MAFLYNEIYDEIPQELLSTDDKTATGFVSELIKSAVPPHDYDPLKISKGILPINKIPREKAIKHPKRTFLLRKDRKKLPKCPKIGWNYQDFKSLRQMWKTYMRGHFTKRFKCKSIAEIQLSDRNFLNHVLAKADYHGAEMKIIRATNPSLVGISGTCIIDTKNTFKIVSKDNKCRTIPKQECVFKIRVDDFVFTVFGKLMAIKPAERSTKKIKSLMVADL